MKNLRVPTSVRCVLLALPVVGQEAPDEATTEEAVADEAGEIQCTCGRALRDEELDLN